MNKTKVNVALLGCGRVASHHVMAIDKIDNLNLVAVCDFNKEILDKFEIKSSFFRYSNLSEMLNNHPEIDIVSVITPSGLHFDQSLDLIEVYKKNVLIEKPIVMTVSEGKILEKATKENNLYIFPSHQYRFNNCVQRIKKGIESGELGTPFLGSVRMRWCRPQRYYDRDPWRGTFAMDGGCFANQGIHHIDLLRYLMGEVKRVNAILKTFGSEIEVEDTGVVNLEFENGALGTLEITTAARPIDYESSLSVVGSKGMAMLGGWATDKLLLYSPDPSQEKKYSQSFTSAYGFGHIDIYKGVYKKLTKTGEEAVTLSDGLKTIKLLHSIYKSDELREWVDLDQSLESERLGKRDPELLKIYQNV